MKSSEKYLEGEYIDFIEINDDETVYNKKEDTVFNRFYSLESVLKNAVKKLFNIIK